MSIEKILNQNIDRRELLKGTGTAAIGIAGLLSGCATIGFKEQGPVAFPPLKGNKVQPPKEGCWHGKLFFDYSNYVLEFNQPRFKEEKIPAMGLLHERLAWYSFPRQVNALVNDGIIPIVTWNPRNIFPDHSLKDVAKGAADNEIREYATSASKIEKPFLLRTLIEMTLPESGHWAWSGQPGHFGDAWKRMWKIFNDQGANEYCTWVWNPYVGQGLDKEMHWYYPGNEYVDWIALNGFNFGTVRPQGWETFDQLFGSAYSKARQQWPQKPLMVAEFACNEEPGKPRWIRQAYNSIKTDYPGIKTEVWWDEDWSLFLVEGMRGSINSSRGSLKAYKEALSDAYYIGGPLKFLEKYKIPK
jgi:hypothetical protein